MSTFKEIKELLQKESEKVNKSMYKSFSSSRNSSHTCSCNIHLPSCHNYSKKVGNTASFSSASGSSRPVYGTVKGVNVYGYVIKKSPKGLIGELERNPNISEDLYDVNGKLILDESLDPNYFRRNEVIKFTPMELTDQEIKKRIDNQLYVIKKKLSNF